MLVTSRRVMSRWRENLRWKHFTLRKRLQSWKCDHRREQQNRRRNSRERRHWEQDRLQLLSAGNLQPDLFRQALPDFLRQAIVHAPRAFFGRVQHGHGRGSSDRDNQPDQG